AHYDEAGLVTFDRYDFKGNPLSKTRRVIADATITPGWTADWDAAGAEAALDPQLFETSTSYDALNRIMSIQYPSDVNGKRALLEPRYSRAGVLESVKLGGDPYILQIAHNAKGQRTLVAYANGVMTAQTFHPDTFLLT